MNGGFMKQENSHELEDEYVLNMILAKWKEGFGVNM